MAGKEVLHLKTHWDKSHSYKQRINVYLNPNLGGE